MINEGFALLTVLSFLGWVFATIYFIFKAFNERGEFFAKKAIKIGIIIIIFYSLWIIGMLNA
ncbi:MAG: hypothetical protein N2202_03400 [Proteobacteria bacterium]|nr:hypothetical protein [Pseudomonadota bacterium]